MGQRADFAQVLATAEAAFLEATGLESVRGVPLPSPDDFDDDVVESRIRERAWALEGFDDGQEGYELDFLTLRALEAQALEADANLVSSACAEVLSAVRCDRPLNPYYWQPRSTEWGELHRLSYIKQVSESLEHLVDYPERFEYALSVELALRGATRALDMRQLHEVRLRLVALRDIRRLARPHVEQMRATGMKPAEVFKSLLALDRFVSFSDALSPAELKKALKAEATRE